MTALTLVRDRDLHGNRSAPAKAGNVRHGSATSGRAILGQGCFVVPSKSSLARRRQRSVLSYRFMPVANGPAARKKAKEMPSPCRVHAMKQTFTRPVVDQRRRYQPSLSPRGNEVFVADRSRSGCVAVRATWRYYMKLNSDKPWIWTKVFCAA